MWAKWYTDGSTLASTDVIMPSLCYMVRISDNESLDKCVSIAQFKLIIRLRKMIYSRLYS